MGSTRNAVLKYLLNHQRSTINELAKAVKISPISVRHHIARLEDEGLVASTEERHGVGRPRRVYYLTEAGMEHFPGRTIRFTNRLLDELKETLPAEQFAGLLAGMGASAADDLAAKGDLEQMSLDERLKLLKSWLTKEGFSVQVQRNEHELIIKETSCPYFYVGQTHGEVCSIDKALIAKALSADPQRTSCLLSGDSHCTYTIPMAAIKQAITS
ncbi:MAG: winged helix-turn-helix transcriptional regulator [Anaerolineales bacterium]|nr:MAG: winged helix-turn-helix transcriptional regulator [Anaerolineales bacterium]